MYVHIAHIDGSFDCINAATGSAYVLDGCRRILEALGSQLVGLAISDSPEMLEISWQWVRETPPRVFITVVFGSEIRNGIINASASVLDVVRDVRASGASAILLSPEDYPAHLGPCWYWSEDPAEHALMVQRIREVHLSAN